MATISTRYTKRAYSPHTLSQVRVRVSSMSSAVATISQSILIRGSRQTNPSVMAPMRTTLLLNPSTLVLEAAVE